MRRGTQYRSRALYSRDIGSQGPRIVFLPGLGGTTRYWEPRLGPLVARNRVTLVDLLGFGRSPKPWTRYTVERHVAELERVLTARAPFSLVGHSLGAILALAYAARHPDQVERLVLIGVPYFGTEERALRYFRQMRSVDRWFMTNVALAAVACVVTRRVLGRILPLLIHDLPREVVEDLVQHTWRSSTSSLWEAIYRHDLARDAAQVRHELPVLFLHGDCDRTAPLAGVVELRHGRARWEIHTMPGVDHHPFIRDTATCLRAIDRGAVTAPARRAALGPAAERATGASPTPAVRPPRGMPPRHSRECDGTPPPASRRPRRNRLHA